MIDVMIMSWGVGLGDCCKQASPEGSGASNFSHTLGINFEETIGHIDKPRSDSDRPRVGEIIGLIYPRLLLELEILTYTIVNVDNYAMRACLIIQNC